MTTLEPTSPREAQEAVLSTLNKDGSRRWMRPKPSEGTYWRRRRVVAYGLMALFFALPTLRLNGKPLVFLDVMRREFTFLGTTFYSTDTLLLMLLMLSIFITVFFFTAVLGRVWCGYACPQTVYMEFLYRPIERLFEGNRAEQRRLDHQRVSLRRLGKYATYLVVSIFIAHLFLAYFVGWERLLMWVQLSPATHPAPFAVMAATTGLMMVDFTYFREQLCVVACPYARLQSVLLDERSLIVAYDARRGEPRGKLRMVREPAPAGVAAKGDCIDCKACVQTCPTGIDIRGGLQLECIACAQCVDACDAIMDRVGKPRGLVGYRTQEQLETGRARRLRPRIVIYPLLLAIVGGLLVTLLANRAPAQVTLLRNVGAPFVELPNGDISNQLRVRLRNRSEEPRLFRIELVDGRGLELVAPENPVRVAGGALVTTGIFVNAPRRHFESGEHPIKVRVTDIDHPDVEPTETAPYRLLGPTH
jgi:cytochrome c oxidase accessory protein FixG